MNFDDAIKAHSAWKMKLSIYLKNPDKSLKADEVCKDDRCDLGKWIYGEGEKYKALPEFSTLKSKHADFHRAAADVIKMADAGKSTSEETQLGGSSAFSQASTAVISALMNMKRNAI